MEPLRKIKCVIVGGKEIGKTSLLNSFVTGPLSPEAVFEAYNGIKVQIEEEGEVYQLELWDTNSAEHHKLIRKVHYENCNVVLICYSVMDHESFKTVRKKVSSFDCITQTTLS
jgi:small GTP-binding protein